MLTTKINLVLLSFFIVFNSFTQDFAAVDEHAMNLKPADDLPLTVQQLIAPFSTTLEKTRAIFTYVATTIEYDCREFHREPSDRKAKTRPEILERAFEKQLGVCAGYAILFDEMCELAGINAEVVPGYARISSRPPNPDRLPSNHAWNAVEIDGQWYLLDATWCAGYIDGECKRFTSLFNDYFFMLEPELFFRQHWPEDSRWQLIETERTAEDFASMPHLTRLPSSLTMGQFSPTKGYIDDDLEVYDFSIELLGADKVFLMMGSRLLEFTTSENGMYEISLSENQVRGRKFIIVAQVENYLHNVIEYRRH